METGWPLLSEVRGLNAFLRHTMQSVSSWCFQTLSSTAGCHLLSHGNTAEDKIVSKAADISSYIFLRIFFLKLPLSFGFDTLYIYIYIYIYTHTHTHTYIYTYIHTHIYVYVYIYICLRRVYMLEYYASEISNIWLKWENGRALSSLFKDTGTEICALLLSLLWASLGI